MSSIRELYIPEYKKLYDELIILNIIPIQDIIKLIHEYFFVIDFKSNYIIRFSGLDIVPDHYRSMLDDKTEYEHYDTHCGKCQACISHNEDCCLHEERHIITYIDWSKCSIIEFVQICMYLQDDSIKSFDKVTIYQVSQTQESRVDTASNTENITNYINRWTFDF